MAKKDEGFPERIYVTREQDSDGEVYYSAQVDLPISDNDQTAAVYELRQTGTVRVKREFDAQTQR